jgi:hypothetical protein
LQKAAEEAVHRHLGGELQAFVWTETCGHRPKSIWPFFEEIERDVRDGIINQAVKQSERYRVYAGKFCPECERPGFTLKRPKVNRAMNGTAMKPKGDAAIGGTVRPKRRSKRHSKQPDQDAGLQSRRRSGYVNVSSRIRFFITRVCCTRD